MRAPAGTISSASPPADPCRAEATLPHLQARARIQANDWAQPYAGTPAPRTFTGEAFQRFWSAQEQRQRAAVESRNAHNAYVNRFRCQLLTVPPVTADLVAALRMPPLVADAHEHARRYDPVVSEERLCLPRALLDMVVLPERRAAMMEDVITNFVCLVPGARAQPPVLETLRPQPVGSAEREQITRLQLAPMLAPFHHAASRMEMIFPDRRLLQFDCGKLQSLAVLLRTLKTGGHRVLLFSQVTSASRPSVLCSARTLVTARARLR